MDKENIFSVTEITRHVKNILITNIPKLYVEGEIANFKRHSSGHIYFSLKDESASLRCVFFRNNNLSLEFAPKEGDKVICLGKVTVFERAGNYQLNVYKMVLSGIGDLQIKFEELKKKLAKEGLFEEKHKQPIAKFPEKIGIVTSATGAALQDIRNVVSRRFPCQIYLYPATVQGDRAAAEIIAGIEYFNNVQPVDTLIIGRGGGSQEDLFCFNDEQLARTIFKSEIPVISAVGHEIDFTISDFVADLRAPTPSAAAELAVPDRLDLLQQISSYLHTIKINASQKIYIKEKKLTDLANRLALKHPQNILQNYQQTLDEVNLKMKHSLKNYLVKYNNKVDVLTSKLEELSPYAALKKGYSIIKQHKQIINSVKKVNREEKIDIKLSDGSLTCQIEDIKAD